VDRHSGDETSFSPQVQEWELEHLKIVAARFPEMELNELAAELAVTLLALKRRRPAGIVNWKAYLTKALFHRASRIIKKWRIQRQRETSIELHPETSETLSDSDDLDPARRKSRLSLSRIRRKLDAESYALVELLDKSNGNQSRVARLLGIHRNTIRNRLQKIRQALLRCPIRNVSGRIQLTIKQWEQLTRAALARGGRTRTVFKAQLILALASGQSDRQIEPSLKTTAPTIARWKRRFEENGIEGLKARYLGRKPRMDIRTLLANWARGSEPARHRSCRRIARKLGIGKSTVHRILREGRRLSPP
jgi:transposase